MDLGAEVSHFYIYIILCNGICFNYLKNPLWINWRYDKFRIDNISKNWTLYKGTYMIAFFNPSGKNASFG